MHRAAANYTVFIDSWHAPYGYEHNSNADPMGDLYDSVQLEPFIVGDLVRAKIYPYGSYSTIQTDLELTPQPDGQNLGHLRYNSGNPITFFPLPIGDMTQEQDLNRVYPVPANGIDSRRAYQSFTEMVNVNNYFQ